ncbi:MAG TPA: hypothetical protein VMF56_08375 [Acidobacteriaceae bacterium]|nr:hypothetical protein [Acidobacteriaceae bacterium]
MERISLPNQRELVLEYDESDQRDFGPCPDCGERTKRVWGYVYRLDAAIATYFVEWTPGHPQRDAVFDLIIGKWGDGATPNDRQAVSVAFKVLESGPSFMVQDASARPIGSSVLISTALGRNAVIGTPLSKDVFEICDLIYLADPRIADLYG